MKPWSDQEIQAWNTKVHHPLQSYQWGLFREKMGVRVIRSTDYPEAKNLPPFQFTVHPLPLTSFAVGYLPKGPCVTTEMIELLKNIAKQEKIISIQIEPDVHQHEQPLLAELKPSHRPLFTRYTFVLDLTKTETELLSAMHPKTRYNLKIAQKNQVEIKETTTDVDFSHYLKLVEETTARQGFYAHSMTYHRKLWETLGGSTMIKLFTASYHGDVLAAWVLFLWNDTIYYPYGASSRLNRQVMAPNLLLWEIVRWGKQQGYKKFDLWGSLGPNPNPNDPFFGFHRFKAGFNPELVEFAGSFDLVINPWLYHLYCLADSIRWKLLKRR